MRTSWRHRVIAVGVVALAVAIPAATAQAAAFPVNPGPIVSGRTIVGSGNNLPPIHGTTYNVGPYMAPQVEAYYASKEFQQDRSDVALAAWRYVRDWTRQHCGSTPAAVKACKAAVVFDVDETLLDSFSYEVAQDPKFTFDPTTWDAYVDACGYAGIRQTRDIFNRFKKLGMHVSLVSAGSRDNKEAMVSCLHQHGIAGWDNYIMRGSKDSQSTFAEYKAAARTKLQRSGLTIVASIGDQVSDMSYGHLHRGFLMPNVMAYLA